jgi:hypothetical protein
MAQRIGIGPGRRGTAGLGQKADFTDLGLILKVAHTIQDDFVGSARSRPLGRRTGNIHQITKHAMSTLGLADDRTQRADYSWLIGLSQKQLGAPLNNSQGVVQLVSSSCGKLGEGFQFRQAKLVLSGLDPLPICGQDRGQSSGQAITIGDQISPRMPGRAGGVLGRIKRWSIGVNAKLDFGQRTPSTAEREHQSGPGFFRRWRG